MAAQSSSLYNEDRNLLRIREQERRNQEALQERDPFIDNAPLFPEPYKTSKGDELSSRIQSMLGNYEEVKELIGAKSHQDLIGIPVTSQGRFVKQHPIQSNTSRSMGPPRSSSMSLGHRNRPRTAPELSSAELVKTHNQNPSLQNTRKQEQRSRTMERSGKQGQDKRSVDISSSPTSILALSPLLSSLSPPVEPLSPLHSSHQIDSKPRGGQSHDKSYTSDDKSPEPANREGSTSVANLVPSSQTFPTYLTLKTHTLPPKPTAYVRPMDGQDQAPTLSPDLKPLQEDYHEDSYECHTDLKSDAKDKLSRVEMASGHFETFTNEAHCVEDILKEMTHSWPPPLTGIHTPSTAEPSKFAFPNKESQQVSSVNVNQRHHDNFSKVFPSPQKGSSMLENDLQISDSEDSDDDNDGDNDGDEEEEEITEKPLSSAPSSVVQSHVDSVGLAHSSCMETEGSETDSSSDSESDSGSTDSEVPPIRRSPSPVHDTSSTGMWQLGNFFVKPAPLAESHNNVEDHEQESHWESKEHDCLSPPPHESPKTELQHETTLWTSQEDIQNKPTFPDSPIANETVTSRQTVGIKHPRRPVKASFQEEPKGGLTVESEPAPYRPRDQPSKEKPTVKTKIKTKSSEYKEPNANVAHPNQKKKHRSSHHSSSTKKCPSTQIDKHQSVPSHLQSLPSSKVHIESKTKHRTNPSHPAVVVREDCHRDKVLLPIGENKLLPPVKRSHKPIALVVKIELSLLSKIPGVYSKISESKSKKVSSHNAHQKERSEKTHNHHKEHTKRKVEDSEKSATHKKLKPSNDNKPSTVHKELSTKKVPKTSSEDIRKEHRQQKASSPTHQTHKKPEKVAQKRRPNESSACSQQSTISSSKSSKEHSTPKQRKVEENNMEMSKITKGSAENNTHPFPVPSLPNGNAKPTRPQLKFEEKLHSPEHYMKEAKKLKHKADAMSDKIGKSLNYLDAAMFFIECGIAMEADVQAPKSAYTMFAETVDLIKFIMKLKNFSDSLAPPYEKSFAVLCMRCQSVLYMAMFRYKKDTALKYSRSLGEHFKSSSRAAQAPSPCVARSTGTPSPISPTPSPASSAGSQPGSNASNSGGPNPSVTIPQMIHHIASSYVNITSYILYAYDIWEQADMIAKKNKVICTYLHQDCGFRRVNWPTTSAGQHRWDILSPQIPP
ncbi:AF4/FMR2 family member 1 isoform X2 [Hyla sarda]|uniref:AF4/FMR2 family member 1 isoform X2 n=1 Tax=Hyla sarda TaxID=327740 RepID=UPI0024C37442|nr:AF4/FMR2 family member 1 isoform X2 [Hyla sarda]